MHDKCEKITSKIWENLKEGNTYKTPDNLKGVAYTIKRLESDKIVISPQNVYIKKNAFVETLYYLFLNGHTEKNKCEKRMVSHLE